MCSYAIVLPDGSHGPGFPSLEEAAEWAIANLPEAQPGWVSVAVTENGETSVNTGIALSRDDRA